MSQPMPRRRGTSKRTLERTIDDIVRAAELESGEVNCSRKRKCLEPLFQTENPKKKQKIEILDIQTLYFPISSLENVEVENTNAKVTNELVDNALADNVPNELADNVNLRNNFINNSDNECNDRRFQTYDLEPMTKDEEFIENIRSWSFQYNICGSALSALLLLLVNYGLEFLPKDSRTFKKTPKSTKVREVEPGIYWHYGIKRYLKKLLEILPLELPYELTLNMSMDGLPLCKSSKGSFWPILGKFKEITSMKPFVIGLYYHISSKPLCPKKYLEELISELVELENNNFMGKVVKIGIFIFDAVASAFIRGVVPHNSYKSCPKCTTTGSYHSRMCYPSMNCSKRTNISFRNRDDPHHHKDTFKAPNSTPLEALNIDVINACPNDYMHLILLGVVKKFLKIILKKMNIPTNVLLRTKLNETNVSEIEKCTALARLYQPSDFSRKIRTLEYISFFKATELRTFLCYHGIVVLKDNINPNLYECFKFLHCAVTICLSNKLIDIFLPLAEELFNTFIQLFIKLFGENMVSYNVHNLQHVVADVRLYGRLDNSSAFEYESFLGKLKKLVHSGKHPLQEVSNRLIEHTDNVLENLKKEIETENKYPRFSKSKLELSKELKLTNKIEDCWFLTNGTRIIRLEKIKIINKVPKIIGKAIKQTSDYYDLPVRSSLLGIFYSNGELEEVDPLDFSDVSSKLFCIPDLKDNKVFITILHT